MATPKKKKPAEVPPVVEPEAEAPVVETPAPPAEPDQWGPGT